MNLLILIETQTNNDVVTSLRSLRKALRTLRLKKTM